ncbi:hypothetical protein KAR91_82850, partial [Candidatus Pacearchaeota archaeon]|nr:hypothetical protein [Candidatus Pacearchaeota archaeon]
MMRKLSIFLLLILLLTTTVCATNELGWTARRAAIWYDIVNNNAGGWWTELNSRSYYETRGILQALSYKATGDNEYASQAWGMFANYCGQPGGYNPGSDCEALWQGKCTGNCNRDRYTQASLVYSLVADGLSAQDKANFKDVLTQWYKQNYCESGRGSTNEGIRTTDTDELLGNYFGMAIFALAIADEDPTLSNKILNHGTSGVCMDGSTSPPFGGIDAGSPWPHWPTTLRDAVGYYLTYADG